CVIVDELHALAGTKRGDQLALGLARLATLSPGHRRIGLSATVSDERALLAYLSPSGSPHGSDVVLVRGGGSREARIEILVTEARLPWSGHMALHAMPEVYARLRETKSAIVFVNTRAQAELVFQELWRLNDDSLAIALHHGSLAVEQRRKVEAAMAAGRLRAVVATSSLDLGIDWASVDLVVQVGAPKGASRLLQRIGRSNHRYDLPSQALLVPGNRFEVLECRAAIAAIRAGTLDGQLRKPGGLDVLAQHLLGTACSQPFDADAMYAEVRRASPYAALARKDFDDAVAFVAGGGYALAAYEKWKRLKQRADGRWTVARADIPRLFRMNIGTIVEEPMLKVRLGGRVLGEVEEYFVQGLVPGDTFMFAGELLLFQGIREMAVVAARGGSGPPKVPVFAGGRLPLTTQLATGVRAILDDPGSWAELPGAVREWLRLQQWRSVLPPADGLLVETFPRGGKEWLVAYCFAGRNAHQTLGMLLTRRMERLDLRPLGFVATDYVLATWQLRAPPDIDALLAEDMLGDDLEEWMAESSLLKRTFRNVAVIAGLIERRHPGQEKSKRQVTFSSDLIYDVLRSHEPDHLLLRATRQDAATGLTDIERLAEMLRRVRGRILHRRLDRVSPLAVPVLLEIGREDVAQSGIDELLDETAQSLIAEATEGPMQAGLPL
ncbi:MAG: ligase-associated DNA damage response DEXH box helicase, partial [Alphaproteobacteria bacterium]|nr:ligase-associated DNA damage response DEXH box helicase [Alphaproteobacteria bacterium]